MRVRSELLVRASAIIIALACPATGFAQQESDTRDREEAAIVVTAVRHNELLLETSTSSRLGISAFDTPAAVNVVEGDAIRALGDFDFLDAVGRAPGVTTSGSPGNGNSALSMRGFSGHGSVTQLYNGVRLFPVAGTITFPFDTWNVEQIEVLNGPGSVLHGQGALGGVVNVIPKNPNFRGFEAQGEVGYGSFNTVRVAAGAGGPIAEGLAFRADGIVRRSDGYVDRGESRSIALSGALEFRPSDNLSLTLRHDFGDNEPMKYFGTPTADGERLDKAIRKKNYNTADAEMKFRDHRTQLSLDWQPAEGLKVMNTAYWLDSYRLWENLESYSYDSAANLVHRSSNLGLVHDVEQYGNQGHIAYTAPLGGGLRNQILVGFDVNLVKLKYEHNFDSVAQQDSVDPVHFDPGLLLDTVGIAPRYRTRTETWAIYAEDRLEIGEQFSIIGGLRYEEDKVERYNYIYDASGENIIGEAPALAGGTESSKKFDDLTWRVGAVFQPTPNISIYGQYVTGVDPVGTLTTFTTSGTQYAFTNATGNQIEAGVKSLFLNGAGAATLSLYRIEKHDLSVQRETNGPIEQIGQQSAKGIEATVSLDLPWGLSIDANGTILDANYDDYPSGALDYTGNTPPGIPESAANLMLQWAANDRLRMGGALRYVGKRHADIGNMRTVGSYMVADINVSYAFTENLAVDARVHNLFDEDYAQAISGSGRQWVLGRPRAFDIAIRAAF